ncbi:XdhC family protein [Candidatus Acetothermia bacterium]|nr:XdhC family protein [Candidatus Acetothermia bacterium]
MDQHHFLRRVYELLCEGRTFTIAYFIQGEGSFPQKPGVKMIVHKNGDFEFTIGGGTIEARILKEATLLPGYHHSQQREYFLGDLGMHCGGLMQIYYEVVEPTEANKNFYGDLLQRLTQNQPFVIAHRLDSEQLSKSIISPGIGTSEKFADDALCSLADAIERDANNLIESKESAELREYRWSDQRVVSVFLEVIQKPLKLLIFGAGHVGRKLAEVAKATGLFQVEVADDRPEYANAKRLSFVDKITLCPHNYEGELPTPDERTFVAVITRCHQTDQVILRKLLSESELPPYLGMIGSVPKRAKLFKLLRDEGVSEERLNQVYSPMGLPIGGKDPGEIAISMLAEIIQVKNQLEKNLVGGRAGWTS